MEKAFPLSPKELNAQVVAQENLREPCYFVAVEGKVDLTKYCFLWEPSCLTMSPKHVVVPDALLAVTWFR